MNGPPVIADIQGKPGDRNYIGLTAVRPGYSHKRYEGVCGPAVTIEDIQRRFYDEHFGGREAYVTAEGFWGCVEHTD